MFTQVTVTGSYTGPDGTPAVGTVTFRLTGPISDGSVQVDPVDVVAVLDTTGAFSQTLDATDDPTTTPAGVLYEVIVRIDDAPPAVFQLPLPHANPNFRLTGSAH